MHELLTDAVVSVGDGRGFLIKSQTAMPLVVTAAHCLAHLPPAHPASFTLERTYNLLAERGQAPSICVECLFVDPIADVAVLGAPDGQVLPDESEAFEQFVENRPTFRVGGIRRRSRAWLLTLDGQWRECVVDAVGRAGRTVSIIRDATQPGMSGSPIVTDNGRAIGLVSIGSETHRLVGGTLVPSREAEDQHGQPALIGTLPGWLLADVFASSSAKFLESIDGLKQSHRRQVLAMAREAGVPLATIRRWSGGRRRR